MDHVRNAQRAVGHYRDCHWMTWSFCRCVQWKDFQETSRRNVCCRTQRCIGEKQKLGRQTDRCRLTRSSRWMDCWTDGQTDRQKQDIVEKLQEFVSLSGHGEALCREK